MSNEVLVDRLGRVLKITLNRPQSRNAIDSNLVSGLREALDTLDADNELRVGVLTGAGKGFCSGMDLKAFAADGAPRGLTRILERRAAKPLVAAIEGFAMAGGLELALCCDFLVVARNAKLGIPEVGVGLFAAGGALYHLPRRVPYGAALEMALTGDPITVEQAFSWGLVNRVAEAGQAFDIALDLADRISRNAPRAVVVSKQILEMARSSTEVEFWDYQKTLVPEIFSSNDAKEGPRAFMEKRAPAWSGT